MKEWHHEQTHRDSCVAACMCIIQKWRGEAPTEAAFHESASTGPQILGRRIRELGGARYAALAQDEERTLDLHLVDGGLVVVGVFGLLFADWQRRVYGQLISRHGEMSRAYSQKGYPHAIVLVERSGDGYRLLDPWFPAMHQPLFIERSDFSNCFDGNAVFVDRVP
ncbi:hypothetical protein [Polyangium mundeleinium]|uniref:Peptidase C39 domain-containing protein n=1 Tax=Polyangium mundeleinium TaxID=2995306 RepID=A0ABT5F3C1_9BACT|nr:hypothetical protein [Polyangium mundeleinium]MDC0748109.1 hypothetical protein [Polyangium mundeleinium]